MGDKSVKILSGNFLLYLGKYIINRQCILTSTGR